MKNLKKNKKFIIVLILAVLISVTSSYVLAETLINSKDVVYEDNSNLMADNVQDAIDGTCTKIDTRLSGIEDNLYIVKQISGYKGITSTKEWSYTGLSVTLPANACCSINYYAGWGYNHSTGILVSSSSTIGIQSALGYTTNQGSEVGHLAVDISECTTEETTRYIWAKYSDASPNGIGYGGFCAIKYKQ